MSIKKKLKDDLKKIAQKLDLPTDKIQVERTKDERRGDYTTNMALQSPKQVWGKTWQTADEIASFIADSFPPTDYIGKVEAVKPGFINFFLAQDFLQNQVGEIVKNEQNFVRSSWRKGRKARVEFISANPTGPLHIGNARGGPLGDTLANVLEAGGYEVMREYLNNDTGGQVEKFGQSIFVKMQGEKNQAGEYQGSYIQEIAERIGQVKTSAEAAKKAVSLILDEILKDCRDMGIQFDEIFHESQFVKKNKTKELIALLLQRKVLKEKEGALWFAPSDEFLGDRECVVVKSDGTYTYFANDIAYHKEKFASDADLVIDILGSGHHGHVPRLRAAVAALGFDPAKLHVILYQFVRVKEGEKVIRMSKRTGNYVSAREVLDAVGRDAFRFFLLMYDPNTHMDFDLELAKKKSQENPVYYVQYAHARIHGILAKSKGKSLKSKGELHLLTHPEELRLIKKLIQLPELVEEVAANFQVHLLASYAISLADTFHKFYEEVRVISDDRQLTNARLKLVSATGIILGTTLKLMGITAPEKM